MTEENTTQFADAQNDITSSLVSFRELETIIEKQNSKISELQDNYTKTIIKLDIILKQKMSFDRDFHRLNRDNRCIKKLNLCLFVLLIGTIPFVFY